MNEETTQQEIQKNVLARIKSGDTHMRSRLFFVVRVAATIAAAAIALIFSGLVLSFIIFSVRESGEQFLLGFGSRGIVTFFALFPWLAFALAIAALFVLEWLLQGFKFGYRISLLSIFLVACVVSASFAALVNLTPLHGVLLGRADKDSLPVIGEMYETVRDSHANQGVFRGTIMAIQGKVIFITLSDRDRDADDVAWTVSLPPGNTEPLSVGDRVYVLGTSTGTSVEAYSIEKFAPLQNERK